MFHTPPDPDRRVIAAIAFVAGMAFVLVPALVLIRSLTGS